MWKGNLVMCSAGRDVSMQVYVEAVLVNVCIAGSAPWLVHFYPGEGIEIRWEIEAFFLKYHVDLWCTCCAVKLLCQDILTSFLALTKAVCCTFSCSEFPFALLEQKHQVCITPGELHGRGVFSSIDGIQQPDQNSRQRLQVVTESSPSGASLLCHYFGWLWNVPAAPAVMRQILGCPASFLQRL